MEKLSLLGSTYSGYGNSLNNSIYGNSSNNYLSGGAGNDAMYGYGGNDYIVGGSDNDQMYGGSNNDTLNGYGGGYDTMSGNAGKDSFILGYGTNVSGAHYKGAGYATITDFDWVIGEKIDVAGSASDYVIKYGHYGSSSSSTNDLTKKDSLISFATSTGDYLAIVEDAYVINSDLV